MVPGGRRSSRSFHRHHRERRGRRNADLFGRRGAAGWCRNHAAWHRRARFGGGGRLVDCNTRSIEVAFKLYPWEWIFHDAFGAKLPIKSPRWIEPPWKAILSNKGVLPLLW